MYGVILERENIFTYRLENGESKSLPSKEFMEHGLGDIMYNGDVTLYMSGLKLWGMGIVFELCKCGFTDITKTILESNSLKNPQFGELYYTVSDLGVWYMIKICTAKGITTILTYENFCPIDEQTLISDFCDGKSDPESLAAGMMKSVEMMYAIGCEGMSVSSSATSLWRKTHNKYDFTSLYRDIQDDEHDFIRSAYHGGFCYVNRKGKVGHGIVLDCNSLYPWVMSTQYLPVGKGARFDGEPKKLWREDKHFGFFVRFSCRFTIKEDHVPFVRIADSDWYRYDQILETSDIYDPMTEMYYDELVDEDGVITKVRATLTMWKDEFELFFEQYDVEDLEFIGGYRYHTSSKCFSKYMQRFVDMKTNAKNRSERRIAKIMMNSLSGNLAKRMDRESLYFETTDLMSIRSFGEYQKREHTNGRRTAAETDEWGHRRYVDLTMEEVFKQVGTHVQTKSRSRSYINLGAAITSIGMVTTVRAAQNNFEHYLYSDTDSIHLECNVEDVVGIEIDDKELGKWKIEHEFTNGTYVQPKVYYIRDVKEGPTVKWSGMKDESRRLLEQAILFLEIEAKDNPFVDMNMEEFRTEHCTDMEWRSFMKSLLKDDPFNVRIPCTSYEMVDFKDFKKSVVDSVYTVDITEFLC